MDLHEQLNVAPQKINSELLMFRKSKESTE